MAYSFDTNFFIFNTQIFLQVSNLTQIFFGSSTKRFAATVPSPKVPRTPKLEIKIFNLRESALLQTVYVFLKHIFRKVSISQDFDFVWRSEICGALAKWKKKKEKFVQFLQSKYNDHLH